jgi:hypothetical protein
VNELPINTHLPTQELPINSWQFNQELPIILQRPNQDLPITLQQPNHDLPINLQRPNQELQSETLACACIIHAHMRLLLIDSPPVSTNSYLSPSIPEAHYTAPAL